MQKKQIYTFYMVIWSIATIFLLTLFWQMREFSHIINYSGLLRGATQKLIKEELFSYEDNDMILYLDDILYDLQTGKGKYNLSRNSGEEYQKLLSKMEVMWEEIKIRIYTLREDPTSQGSLFSLTQEYYHLADEMVLQAEKDSLQKSMQFLFFYFTTILLSIGVFIYTNMRNSKDLKKSLATDSLTGILSRAGFEEAASKLLHKNPNTQYVVVEFDLYNFTAINNAYGYVLGDIILKAIADSLSHGQFDQQISGRMDADHFVMLLDKSSAIIPQLELCLLTAIKKLDCSNYIGQISFTFGAYDIAYNSEEIKIAMDKATIAHKIAKTAESPSSTVWYDDTLIHSLEQEHYYDEHLQQGIDNKEFQMYLQPQIDLKTMQTVGAEALVRWNLPNKKIVSPDAFIPLFEKKGIMSKLDFYMLENACAYLRDYFDKGNPEIIVAVNFSRTTLYQSDFETNFLNIIDRYQLPHNCIEIEVVETALNEVHESVIETLNNLATKGIHISMDDFGAGYSNLSCLSTLPVHTVKLDRQFLLEVDRNENMKTITTSIIDMAHQLGMKVLCEGVEEKHHIEFLQSIGCDYAQGYYFCRPVPKEKFNLTLVANHGDQRTT